MKQVVKWAVEGAVKCDFAKYSATCWHTSVAGDMSVFRKARVFFANQGGTTDKLLFVLGRKSVKGVFVLF